MEDKFIEQLVINTTEIAQLKQRITNAEEEQKTTRELAISVQTLAVNMKHMLEELTKQCTRLDRLESKPTEDFSYYKRIIIGTSLTGIIGAIVGAIITLIIK